jgi:hypothetical protein
MADDLVQGSPEWWLERLVKRLDGRRERYDRLDRYESGEHTLPEGDDRARDLFQRFQRKARTNYCGLVISSVSERLHVAGFRTGGESTNDVDREAWRIWQANHLDADSELVHDDALTLSDAYVIVGPNEADPATPVITVESPFSVVGEPDPMNRRVMAAALKTWTDEGSKADRAVLYLPDRIYYFERPTRSRFWARVSASWSPADEVDSVENPLGVVPVVRFVNRPRTKSGGEGRGEFEDAIDIQDRINNVVLDRLIIAKMQAYRQRYMTGVPTEDEDGNPVDLPFVPGVDLLWHLEDPEGVAKFGEFQQVDLTPILKAAAEDVKAFTTVTGLPPHYVAGDLVNASADALAAAEARHVARCDKRKRAFSESWEQVMALAFRWRGDALPADTEVIWTDSERKTDAQLADAAVKKQQAGVPWSQRMEDLGYSPQTIDRMESQRAQDALMASLAAPPQPTAPAPGVTFSAADGGA